MHFRVVRERVQAERVRVKIPGDGTYVQHAYVRTHQQLADSFTNTQSTSAPLLAEARIRLAER